jgi:hypothetical protein
VLRINNPFPNNANRVGVSPARVPRWGGATQRKINELPLKSSCNRHKQRFYDPIAAGIPRSEAIRQAFPRPRRSSGAYAALAYRLLKAQAPPASESKTLRTIIQANPGVLPHGARPAEARPEPSSAALEQKIRSAAEADLRCSMCGMPGQPDDAVPCCSHIRTGMGVLLARGERAVWAPPVMSEPLPPLVASSPSEPRPQVFGEFPVSYLRKPLVAVQDERKPAALAGHGRLSS